MTKWAPIKGFEGRYAISNTGQVMNIGQTVRHGNILKGSLDRYGYKRVTLRKNQKDKRGATFLVHRLVAETFIPNPLNLPCVNHKNENKIDNNVNNLEWCDVRYNDNYGTRNSRIVTHRDWSTSCKPVARFKDGLIDKIYPNAKSAAVDTMGKERGKYNIRTVCNGSNPHAITAYGYGWKYLNEGAL